LPWRTRPGLSLVRLDVDAEGFFDLDQLETVLRAHNQEGRHGTARIKLVAVSGASNVLGVFNPLDEVSRIVHRYGAELLVDAAQLVAHRPIDMQATGIDYLVFSGHKIYAPFGTGVLVARKGRLQFTPLEMGQIHASGEENVGGIAALGEALSLMARIGWDTIQKEEHVLTRYALTCLATLPSVRVYGIKDPESPRFARKGGVILFGMKGMLPHRVARSLAEQGGVGVRSGCHCAHLAIKRLLHVPAWAERIQWLMLSVARHMRLPGLVRMSLGLQNTELDVDAFVDTLKRMTTKPTRARLGGRMDEFVRTASQRVFG
jgi:selenocysteine lyase/cysteine desulfurase